MSKTTNEGAGRERDGRRRGREEQLAALQERISEGVEALVSSEAWRAMLEVAARFHAYSLNNQLLIAVQCPGATRVAGFRTWQGLGRQVRRGERGIAILAPCTYRPKRTQDTEDAGSAQDGQDATGDAAGTGGEAQAEDGRDHRQGARALRGFRVAHVFDVAQTDGDPLPEVAPELLAGQAPGGLWEALAAQVTAHGYTLERGECGHANGWTNPGTRTVRVRGDVEDAQAVKTLAHELAHIECGHVADLPTYTLCRGACEVEAESVAYVVGAAAGLDTAGYTFAYVAGWAGGDPAAVRRSAETATTAARTILARLDPTEDATAEDATGEPSPAGSRTGAA